jgi:hypothetical protein
MTRTQGVLCAALVVCSASCGQGVDHAMTPMTMTQMKADPMGPSCRAAAECSSYACRCSDGTLWTAARFCFNGACQGATATCNDACKNNQQVPVAQLTGCRLSKYSTEFSVTMETYGSANSRSEALTDAQSQCVSGTWAGWFCSSASESCGSEPAVSTTCTFSKYSADASTTVRFSGRGRGATAAKRAAVNACIASGRWRGWFCTSGTLSCAAD